MLIQNWCSITLGGVDILLPSDELQDELTPPARTATYQPADYFRAPFKDRIGRGLVEHTFSFTRSRLFPNGQSARTFAMQHAAALPIVPGDCLIADLLTNGAWKLSRAVLLNYSPKVHANRFIATYTLAGGEYAETAAPATNYESENPGIAPGDGGGPGEGGDNLVDDGGGHITDDNGNPITDDAP